MIREFTKNDYNTFMELSREFYNTTAVDHKIPDKNRTATFEASVGNSPYAKGFIIECNGEVAGYCLISLTFSGEVGGLVVLVEELYIKEKFQGNGLGTECFSFIEDLYKDAKRFRLEVTRVNDGAIKLYTRLGYSEIAYKQMIKDKE